MLRLPLLLLVLTTSCSITSLFGVPLRCDGSDSCPDDESCENGVCVVVGEGEGDLVGEGEGDLVGGEGEGDLVVGKGEGEGDLTSEGEGDLGEGEGDGACGNARVDDGEGCDDGNANNNDDCVACNLAICGDRFVLADTEECDDGNSVSGDACTNLCLVARCGDGVLYDGVESCDDGNDVPDDECPNDCGRCGNGRPDVGEACDDGNAADGDGCDSNCTPTRCGNGVTAQDEVCDDGGLVDGDGCDSNCTPTRCGNGIVTTAEACDDGDADTLACTEACDTCVTTFDDDMSALGPNFEARDSPGRVSETGSSIRLSGEANRTVRIQRLTAVDVTPSRIDLDVDWPALVSGQTVTVRLTTIINTLDLVASRDQLRLSSLFGNIELDFDDAANSGRVTHVTLTLDDIPRAVVTTTTGTVNLALVGTDLSAVADARLELLARCTGDCPRFDADFDRVQFFPGCAFE